MKPYISTFKFGLRQLTRDYMLILMVIAPFLCGIVFKFLIPALDDFIAYKFGIERVIFPYYQILDNLLVFLAPSLICTVSSFLILEERDDKVSQYIFVTPIGYRGYIFARLIIPSIFAFSISFLIIMIFQLTHITVSLGISLGVLSTMYAISTTLLVVSKANNKVEGLALTKLTGLTFLGVLAPYFIKGNTQYFFVMLPSFWIGKVMLEQGSIKVVIAIGLGLICSATWIAIFYRAFKSKVA